MGLVIHSASICDNSDEYSAIKLAVNAGEKCILKSKLNKPDIDLLISIGIYRDKHITEPAIASLIQNGLQLNNDPIKAGSRQMTFSFDLTNGMVSFINTIEIIDTMFQTGESKHALIVSSDTHPSQTQHPDFPFKKFGAAMLFTNINKRTEPNQYFYNTSGDGYPGLKSYVKAEKKSHKNLYFNISSDFTDKLMNFTIDSIKEGVAANKLDLSGIEAVITSQPCKDFGKTIAQGIGLSSDIAIDTYDQYSDTCSSALILGYYTGIKKGRIKEKTKILFIAVGSGLSMGCCVL